MSAFSRGFAGFLHRHSLLLPSSIRATIFSQRPLPSRNNAQVFAAAFRRHASSAANRQHFKYPTPVQRSLRTEDPVLRAVEALQKPILIYRSPPRRLRNLVTYAFACGLVGTGMWTLKWRYELPKDLPSFVGPTYVLIGFIMLIMAGYVFSAPVTRCMSLEILPSRGPVQVRVLAKVTPFPYPPERVIITNLADIALSEKTNPIVRELQEAERARTQNISEGLEGMFITRRGWEWLARFIEQKWTSFFLSFKFTVLRFGIVQLKVGNDKWKIDCSGFLLEDGKAMDRLISEY